MSPVFKISFPKSSKKHLSLKIIERSRKALSLLVTIFTNLKVKKFRKCGNNIWGSFVLQKYSSLVKQI